MLLGILHAKETGISSGFLVFGLCVPLPFFFTLFIQLYMGVKLPDKK